MNAKTILHRAVQTLVCLVIGFVLFWFMLPALNPRSSGFWGFLIINALIWLAVFSFPAIKRAVMGLGLGLQNGKVIPQNGAASLRSLGKVAKIVLIAVVAIFVLMMLASVVGAEIFNASSYRDLITVTDGNFAADVAELSMSQIPVVDRDTAMQLGKRKLGNMSDLVSQFEIADDYTQINYHGSPVRVTPLTYADAIKWLNNQSTGIPAYIMVDMVTQEATLVRLEQGIKYSPGEYFVRNLERHLRFNYPTKIFEEISFEIDEDGTPYWVAPTVSYQIGWWNGTDISGAVLVNAVTGDCQYYDVADIPSWVDQVYESDLVIEQLNYYGEYQRGFWNSVFGQKDMLQTTEGYNYLAIGDDVYLYTGMTSVLGDESNVGFVLVNLRTKQTKFYAVPGAEEYSAMNSAEGQVQHLNYSATFPLLLNVSDRPTYFMSLKDAAGLVKMYAFVDVERYQVVGTGNSVAAAREAYIQRLAEEELSTQPPATDTSVSGTVQAVTAVVIDGNTHYYFRLEQDDALYLASVKVSPQLAFLQAGDAVKVTYTEKDGVRHVQALELVTAQE